MRKFLLMVLALCLCCSLAFAEVSVVNANSLDLNEGANTFVMRTDNRNYQVVDKNLNVLSGEYNSIYTSSGLYTVTTNDGYEGVLDVEGRIMVPAVYGDAKVLSDRWAVGFTLKNATAENYDYKNTWGSDVKFFLVDTVDVYFNGVKVHTFDRMEYDTANAFGDYLIVQDREKKCKAFDKDFKLSDFVPEYAWSEYDYNYRTKKIIHIGSGKEAFTEGCTLTADEVKQCYYILDNKVYDLQGNVLSDLTAYYSQSLDTDSGLIKVRDNYKKYGLVKPDGTVLVSCAYDEISYRLDIALKTGYVYAVRDGKSGFVSLKDGSEKGFEFLESAGNQRSAFIVIEDPREGVILISCAAGELPGRYKSVNIPYTSCAMYATVEEFDGRIHVIDVLGNEVLEDNPEIRSSYDVEFSTDGTLILVEDLEQKYHIYTMDPSVYIQPVDSTGAGEPAADDGSWTCGTCGAENTGKFCTSCGAAKPAEQEGDGTWTCENGHAGNTGNFCGECGAKKPE